MIADNALRVTGLNKPHHLVQHGRAIRPAVRQVADKYEPPPVLVSPVLVIAKMAQQVFERIDFAMDIADDINRAVKQGFD